MNILLLVNVFDCSQKNEYGCIFVKKLTPSCVW